MDSLPKLMANLLNLKCDSNGVNLEIKTKIMQQQKIKVMNIKTGHVFDMTQTGINTLKKHNLFHNYMVVNETPMKTKIVETKPIEQPEPIQTTESFAFTNYVETNDGTSIEMDNEKPKRKYNKKSQ